MVDLEPVTPLRTNGQNREEPQLERSASGSFKILDEKQKYYQRTGKSVLTSSSSTSGSARIDGPQVWPKETLKDSKAKSLKPSEAEIVDLTNDSPLQNVRFTSEFPAFLKRHHRVRCDHRPSRSLDRRIQCQILEGETSLAASGATLNPKPSESQITTDRHVTAGNFNAERGELSELANGLDNEKLNVNSSGGNDNGTRVAISKRSEQSTRKTSKSNKILPIKRSHPSPAIPVKRRQQFKPPRMLHSQRSAGGSTSGGMQSPIEIDDSETPVNDSSNMDLQSQMDEDEMLARVLQEEYSLEDSGGNALMDDAQLARILQEEENARTRQTAQPTSHMPNSSAEQVMRRELQRVVSSFRPGAGIPPSNSSRMRILRNIHHRHSRMSQRSGPRTANSAENLFHFPEGLDLDTRLEVLASLEMASLGSFPLLNHASRDFNESDYEMLLALDEMNGSHHRGASRNQIERLPVSEIQPTDVCEECSICLDTPVVGDVVRRLPCMHSFHRQCIDQWLGQQAKCPVCKVGL